MGDLKNILKPNLKQTLPIIIDLIYTVSEPMRRRQTLFLDKYRHFIRSLLSVTVVAGVTVLDSNIQQLPTLWRQSVITPLVKKEISVGSPPSLPPLHSTALNCLHSRAGMSLNV